MVHRPCHGGPGDFHSLRRYTLREQAAQVALARSSPEKPRVLQVVAPCLPLHHSNRKETSWRDVRPQAGSFHPERSACGCGATVGPERSSDEAVSQPFAPLSETLVGSEDDATGLVPGRHQGEEGSGRLPVIGPDAELVHHQNPVDRYTFIRRSRLCTMRAFLKSSFQDVAPNPEVLLNAIPP